jgi:hypothetical protein
MKMKGHINIKEKKENNMIILNIISSIFILSIKILSRYLINIYK